MRVRRVAGAAVGAVATVLLTGSLAACDGAVDPARPDPLAVEVPTVPAAQGPLTDDAAWWAEGVLHVGARQEEVGEVQAFAVADRTVAFLDSESRLCFTDLEAAECSSLVAYDTPVISPDGHHLGFLEASRGRRDEFGQPRLTTVVLDLDSGDLLLASSTGMGDPAEEDLTDLYEDAEPSFVGFTDGDAAIVRPASAPVDGDLVLPLYDPEDPGASSPEDDDLVTARRSDLAVRDLPGQTVRVVRRGAELRERPGAVRDSTEEGRVSPDRSSLVIGPAGSPLGLLSGPAPAGRAAAFTGQQQAWWSFGTWAGGRAFLATTLDRDQTTYRVYRCDAASRRCVLQDRVPAGDGARDAVVFPSAIGADTETLG